MNHDFQVTYRTALTKKYRTPIAVIPIKTYKALLIIAPSRSETVLVLVVVRLFFDTSVLLLIMEASGLVVLFDLCSLSSAKETAHKVNSRGINLKCVILA